MTEWPQETAVIPLTRELAERHLGRLFELVTLIRDAPYTPDDILAESKPDGRVMRDKWQHSFAVIEGDEVLGFIMGYLRAGEDSANYPTDTIYVSELAVDTARQGHGLGRRLMDRFLEAARNDPDTSHLPVSLQTNSADWNAPVHQFYASLGFEVVGHKAYDNRVDLVMQRPPEPA